MVQERLRVPVIPGAMSGVALAGKISNENANTNIMSIPTHHTGKLELITAKAEVSLSRHGAPPGSPPGSRAARRRPT